MEDMKPGRELDALIAEKIFNLKVEKGWIFERREVFPESKNGLMLAVIQYEDVPVRPKAYSIDIAAAWQVVEKLGGTFRIETDHANPIEWRACFCTMFKSVLPVESIGIANTAPHAICLAALKAVRVDSPSSG